MSSTGTILNLVNDIRRKAISDVYAVFFINFVKETVSISMIFITFENHDETCSKIEKSLVSINSLGCQKKQQIE